MASTKPKFPLWTFPLLVCFRCRAYWDHPLCCVCYLGYVCIYHLISYQLTLKQKWYSVCVWFFFFFFRYMKLVLLTESPCLFEISSCFILEFWDFALVWLDHIAWQSRFFQWQGNQFLFALYISLSACKKILDVSQWCCLVFSLHGLFYVITWRNLLQKVSANGVILILCFAIYIHVFFFCVNICLFVYTFIITEEDAYIFIYYL